jgi:hypothetical protein
MTSGARVVVAEGAEGRMGRRRLFAELGYGRWAGSGEAADRARKIKGRKRTLDCRAACEAGPEVREGKEKGLPIWKGIQTNEIQIKI